jgi:hypothetical protein
VTAVRWPGWWRRGAFVLIAVVAAALAMLALGRDPPPAPPVIAPPPTHLARAPRLSRLARLVAAAPVSERAGLHMLDDPSLPLPVADYLIASRFPPGSRPLAAGMLDLIEPDRRHETPASARRADRTIADASLQVLWTGDRFRLVGDAAMAVWLEVTRDGAPAAVTVTSARAIGLGPDHTPLGIEVPLALGRDPSGIWTGSFAVAGTALARHRGGVALEVAYDHGGAEPGVARFEIEVHDVRDPPAVFTGRHREEMVAGSLFLHVAVDVVRAGDYVIDANLFDGRGQPTAFVRWKGALAAGPAEIPLELYGRIVHELGAEPPFTLTDLRGYRLRFGEVPDRELMADGAEVVTRSYDREAFTRDEFWDAAKQAQVERLLDAARRGTKTILRTTLGEAIDAGWEPRL